MRAHWKPHGIRGVLAVVWLSAAMTSAGAADDKASTSLSVVSPGNLTVCMDPTYPPLEFFRAPGDTEPVGFDVDLSKEVATMMGLGLRIMKADFAGLLSAVQAGRCDIVASGATIQEKRTKVLPAVAYLQTGRSILTRKGERSIKSPEDLSGKTIAVQTGTSFVGMAEKLNEQLRAEGKPLVSVQVYPKATEVFEQLRNGRVRATITNVTEVAYRESITPGLFEIAYNYPEKELLGIYFKASDPMRDALTGAVRNLRTSGKLAEMARKWGLPASAADIPN